MTSPLTTSRNPIVNGALEDSKAVGLKGWRFPLSRLHLWDRQPVDERITLSPNLFLPTETTLSSPLLAKICKEECGETLVLAASWSVCHNGSQQLHLDQEKTSNCDATSSVVCPYRDSGNAEKKIPRRIANQLENSIQRFIEGLETSPECSTLFPMAFERHKLKLSGEMILEGFMAVPDSTVSLAPIRMKNIVDLPLASSLKSEMRSDKAQLAQVGYLSMDTCRRLIPLLPDDTNVQSMPLVGIWIGGLSSLMHPSCMAACLRFQHTSSIADKAMLDGSFLVLLYGKGDYSPKLYECRFDDESMERQISVFYSCRVFERRSSGAGNVKIKWKLESCREATTCTKNKTSLPPVNTMTNKEVSSRATTIHKRETVVNEISFSEEIPFAFTAKGSSQLKRCRDMEAETKSNEIQFTKSDFLTLPCNSDSRDMPPDSDHRLQSTELNFPFPSPKDEFTPSLSPAGVSDEDHEAAVTAHSSLTLRSRSSSIPDGVTEESPIPSGLRLDSSILPTDAPPDEISLKKIEPPSACKDTGTNTQDIKEEKKCEPCSQCLQLQQDVNALKDKVKNLPSSPRLQFAFADPRSVPDWSPESSPSKSCKDVDNTLAIVPVTDVRDSVASHPPVYRHLNPYGPHLSAYTPAPDHRMLPPLSDTQTNSHSHDTSLDLPSFQCYPFLNVALFDGDDRDDELEMLSRKYLGKGITSS